MLDGFVDVEIVSGASQIDQNTLRNAAKANLDTDRTIALPDLILRSPSIFVCRTWMISKHCQYGGAGKNAFESQHSD